MLTTDIDYLSSMQQATPHNRIHTWEGPGELTAHPPHAEVIIHGMHYHLHLHTTYSIDLVETDPELFLILILSPEAYLRRPPQHSSTASSSTTLTRT